MKPRTVFLMYHELELSGRPLCHSDRGYVRYILPASDFHAQMQSLRGAGWQGLSVSEALRFRSTPGVAVTFDDGCESDLVLAAPILRELGFGATFYVTSGFLGNRGYLSVRQLKELSDLGFEVGCHSMNHPYLSDLDDDASLDREIVTPKSQLEQILGRAVEHFSCPGGRYNQRVVEIAKGAGYRTLATSRSHANSRSTDPFALGRVAVMRGTNLDAFQSICRGQSLWRMRVMDLTRGMAKQLMGNSAYERMRTVLLGRSHDSSTPGN